MRPPTVWLVTEMGSQSEADGIVPVACLVISDIWLRLCVGFGTKKLLRAGLVTRVVIGDEPPLVVGMPFDAGLLMKLVLEDEAPVDYSENVQVFHNHNMMKYPDPQEMSHMHPHHRNPIATYG